MCKHWGSFRSHCIASTSKHTPSWILLTSSTTAHSILFCTRPGDKIPYPPTNVTTTRSTRKPNYCWRQWWRIRWMRQQFSYSRINILHTGFFPFTLSRMHRSTQYICNHCYQRVLGHWVSDCPRSWSWWLQHSGGYCYETFSFFYMCLPCVCLLFFISLLHALTSRQTCLLHMFFTSCFTCVCLKVNTFLYLFKPVVRQVYSLAFH